MSTGDGDGDMKNGVLQGGSGPPHSWMLPANEDLGNFESVRGIEPLRLFSDTSKSVRGAVMLGICPEKLFDCKNNPVR